MFLFRFILIVFVYCGQTKNIDRKRYKKEFDSDDFSVTAAHQIPTNKNTRLHKIALKSNQKCSIFNQCNQTPVRRWLKYLWLELVYNLSIILLAIHSWPSTYIFYLIMIQSAFMHQNWCPVVGCRLSAQIPPLNIHDYYLKDFFLFAFFSLE